MEQFLRQTFDIGPEDARAFAGSFSKKVLEKGATFISHGEVCHKIGFIHSGLMKCVFLKNGQEVVDDFVFEKSFVTNYYSFLQQQPSSKAIICIEDTQLAVIHHEAIAHLAKQLPFIESLARQIAERLFIATHEKLESFRLDNAEARYLQLLARKPDLWQKVPQYEIASYLNISPETLSRIRKRLAERS